MRKYDRKSLTSLMKNLRIQTFSFHHNPTQISRYSESPSTKPPKQCRGKQHALLSHENFLCKLFVIKHFAQKTHLTIHL